MPAGLYPEVATLAAVPFKHTTGHPGEIGRAGAGRIEVDQRAQLRLTRGPHARSGGGRAGHVALRASSKPAAEGIGDAGRPPAASPPPYKYLDIPFILSASVLIRLHKIDG